MQIKLISFGKIAEFVTEQNIEIENISNTDELCLFFEKKYPALANMKYKVALNKNLVQQNSKIENMDTVALMPPFSGG
ncbi:MoaD/ThiS family protein [Pedobacter nototheniae]|uniref:MoaD/ThiS family protein n=1 Tax=Pedobacter nototheniae TaxID=2488994 RepID=UPI00292EA216|nr:MoaD/ThiS family protein [Pedobacter nototheniae]